METRTRVDRPFLEKMDAGMVTHVECTTEMDN